MKAIRIAVLAVAFALPFAALAEDVVTKTDGAKLRGKVISDTPEEVKIKTAGGVITIPRGEVSNVDRAKDLATELAARAQDLEKHSTADGWLKLSHWCNEHELYAPAYEALKRVIRLDPENEAARVELGFRKLHGRWMTEGEYWHELGYIQVDGQWITQKDKEKLDQGLMKWGDDDWVTQEEFDRRQKAADAEKERERQGTPTKPDDRPTAADPGKEATPAAPKARKGSAAKEEKPRYFEGKLLYTKSRDQILKTLDQIANEAVPPLGKPTITDFAPLDDRGLASGLRKLKQYRYLSDVPTDVDLNPDYAVKCMAACRLLEIVGHLDHTPQKPPGCPDNLYKIGYDGTSHSNLHMSSMGTNSVESVDSFMFDSDPSNIDRVGHRRWCLNSTQKQTAFGVKGQYAAMYSLDQQRAAVPYDAVLYPARGYFPANYIRHDAAWSAHLSHQFGKPGPDVKVTITPVDVNMRKGKPLDMDYLHVDEGGFGYGVACVIFRAKQISMAPGDRYWVAITGLKEASGADTALEYLVEFF
jgi:hypothetical protein